MSPTSYRCSIPRYTNVHNYIEGRSKCILYGAAEAVKPSTISTAQLNTSPCVHLRPINLVVYQGPYPVNPVGDLISRQASRLDAFSAYPFPT